MDGRIGIGIGMAVSVGIAHACATVVSCCSVRHNSTAPIQKVGEPNRRMRRVAMSVILAQTPCARYAPFGSSPKADARRARQ